MNSTNNAYCEIHRLHRLPCPVCEGDVRSEIQITGRSDDSCCMVGGCRDGDHCRGCETAGKLRSRIESLERERAQALARNEAIAILGANLIGKACAEHSLMVSRMGLSEFVEKHPPDCMWCLIAQRDALRTNLEQERARAKSFDALATAHLEALGKERAETARLREALEWIRDGRYRDGSATCVLCGTGDNAHSSTCPVWWAAAARSPAADGISSPTARPAGGNAMSEHSPGPWLIDGKEILSSDYRHVALVMGSASNPTTQADARLIASAPTLAAEHAELVKALRAALKAHVTDDETGCCCTRCGAREWMPLAIIHTDVCDDNDARDLLARIDARKEASRG